MYVCVCVCVCVTGVWKCGTVRGPSAQSYLCIICKTIVLSILGRLEGSGRVFGVMTLVTSIGRKSGCANES